MSEAYRYIVNRSRDFITLIDREYRYVLVNDAYCQAIERARSEILNRTVMEVWGEERFTESIKPQIDECLAGNEVHFVDEFRFGAVRKSLHVSFYPYADEQAESASDQPPSHVLVFSHDITRLADVESRLAHFEYRDRTTGLLNRRALEETLRGELERANRTHDRTVALLFVSLHSFKAINQTHGHHIGDLLLENTGNRIREAIRSSDQLFRFDGTNLVVLLPRVARATDAAMVAQKIADDVGVPYQYRGKVITITSHIGISLAPDDADNPDALIQRANSTSVEAEERGFQFLFYDRRTHDRALDRMTRLSDLHEAIASQQLELCYHPILRVDGDRPKIVGAEALIRWNHPDRGLLVPDEFMEIAEDSRLIVAIDKWALFRTVRDLAGWLPDFDLFLSMNVSAQEFNDEELPEIVASALEQYPEVESGRLKIELTERRSMQDPEASAERMKRLGEHGVDIWIDDFGIGQSSLAYLKTLPASTLKIDRSLIDGIETQPNERSYLAGILATIGARGKEIIVEGIQSAGQLDVVKELGCTLVQGYYFTRPMSAEEFSLILRDGIPGLAAGCNARE